jgi:hypothetical protein
MCARSEGVRWSREVNLMKIDPKVSSIDAAFFINEQMDKDELIRDLKDENEILRNCIFSLHDDRLEQGSVRLKQAKLLALRHFPTLTVYTVKVPKDLWFYKVLVDCGGVGLRIDNGHLETLPRGGIHHYVKTRGLTRMKGQQALNNWSKNIEKVHHFQMLLLALHGAEESHDDWRELP